MTHRGKARGSGARRPVLIASLIAAMLALLNWYAITAEIDISPASYGAEDAAAPLAPIAQLHILNQQLEPAAFPQTAARPLFQPNRRPADRERKGSPPAPAAASKRPAKLPSDVELVGIMREGRSAGRALIRTGDDTTGQWIEIGHVLDGWRLSRIEGNDIVFEADGRSERLTLFPAQDKAGQIKP